MTFEKDSLTADIKGFSARLKEVVKNESVRSFSRRVGMSDRGFRAYLSGDSYPTLEKLVLISRIGGVELDWLATGSGRCFKDNRLALGDVADNEPPNRQSEKIMEMLNGLSDDNRREILHRIESLHEADRNSKQLEDLLNEVEELKNKLA